MELQDEPWFLKSKKPVSFPQHRALNFSDQEFEVFIKSELAAAAKNSCNDAAQAKSHGDKHAVTSGTTTETSTSGVLTPASSTEYVGEVLGNMEINTAQDDNYQSECSSNSSSRPSRYMTNMMLTENGDLAHRSTKHALVDLFSELEDVISGPRLIELLNLAWDCDPEATLKIIFNARSIHLGKSSRHTFYKCAGWLFQKHPATLITNLRWLSRPVIQKKVLKEEGDAADKAVLIEFIDVDENDPAHHNMRNGGVSHGYWKDLLNILALAVNASLHPLASMGDILNVDRRKDVELSKVTKKEAKRKRCVTVDNRHKNAVDRFQNDAKYRALHLAVARLFAEQLKLDLAHLGGDEPPQAKRRRITLCAKWAPSAGRFHDKHSYITSTIAELLSHESATASVNQDREKFIRHAREGYRKDVAALRRHLEVVERDLTNKSFDNIHYDRLPSLAMKNYTPIFVKKDWERFDAYMTRVASGKANISGAVLSPSTLVKSVCQGTSSQRSARSRAGSINAKVVEMQAKVADAQWVTLVKRIRESGTLENSIAVCDVSGSMGSPRFKDGTCPMDSAIGLSLLVAEVCQPPFGGSFITFSSNPSLEHVKLAAPLSQKVQAMRRANWGMSTDFVAVFEKLILPMAVKEKVRPEDMVKRVFVFSDMQFNQATCGGYSHYSQDEVAPSEPSSWSTGYERVRQAYRSAGYEVPELVFWNLAGGRAGVTGLGDPTAPKPVTAAMEGTSLVSGYSQGMLKVFLEGAGFEDPEDDDEDMMEVVRVEDSEEVEVKEHKRQKTDDSFDTVRKAISHQAYSMLKVVD